jgi:hypothetical protein
VWVLPAILLLVAIPVFAQSPTGTILGVVKDASGASVPNAAVTVMNVETGLTRTLMAGDDGAYRFPALLVGHYTVKAQQTGFKTEAREGLVLDVAQEAVVNFTLQVGTTQEQIVVTGEATVVNVTNSSIGGLINPVQMADLPLNSRNYIDLVLLQKGVAKAAAIGNGQGCGSPKLCAPVISTGYGVVVHRRNAVSIAHDRYYRTSGRVISSPFPQSSPAAP